MRERRRSSPALRAAMTLVLLLLGVSAAFVLAVPPTISGNITFHPPVSLGTAKWGVTMFAAFNHSTHAVQMPHGMMQVIMAPSGGAFVTLRCCTMWLSSSRSQ